MLKGLTKTLERQDAPDIICEVLPNLPELDGMFHSFGYTPYRILDQGRLLKVEKIEFAGGTDSVDYLFDYLLVKRPERLRYWESLNLGA